MTEIVHFVLGGFWRFLGALMLVAWTLHGIAKVILAFRGIAVVDETEVAIGPATPDSKEIARLMLEDRRRRVSGRPVEEPGEKP